MIVPKKSLRPQMRPDRMEDLSPRVTGRKQRMREDEPTEDLSPRAERGDIELMLREEELRKTYRNQIMREDEPTEEEASAIKRGNRAKRRETKEGFYRGGDVRYAYGGSVKARGTCY
jgi:Asp-tRNA(Asn)/Glu-tRNA(Gln) amidotransferase C subunit